ncbi:MAG: F0F1 ATP synthase subunit B [Proteobacteria bacterium]|nr:F0F1 ATP synthase subunit B [Pseudomonadota bacterium]MDE3208856.1 F0F1 ATP synthase subunit B [Pseudomonadota bacterium]
MNVNATIIGQMITFIILIWFVMKYVWTPITAAMEARSKKIADGLAAGERGQHQLELAAHRAEDVLRDAREKASEMIATAEKRGGQIVEQAKEQARVEADRLIVGAKAEIQQEISRARESLRLQVAGLVVAGAEQILRREVDAKVHAKLLSSIENEI